MPVPQWQLSQAFCRKETKATMYSTKKTRVYPSEHTVSSTTDALESFAVFHGPNAQERADAYAAWMNARNATKPTSAPASTK